MEIFKAVQGYEELYQVSNYGSVKSLPKLRTWGNRTYLTKERFLKQRKRDGYFRVNLCGVGKMKTICVHVLVINAFKKNIDGKTFVNHKDLNKLNNNSENLEWTNNRENCTHARKEIVKTSKYTGVFLATGENRYQAKTLYKGKRFHHGRFDTEIEAFEAIKKFHESNNIINKYL